MLVLRPIKKEDFEGLKQIAIESGHGFTSLPVDDNMLNAKIERSVESFRKQVGQALNESYLFVLEDLETNQVVGTTAIEAAVGMDVPLYHYHIGKTIHHSRTLGVYNTLDILTMCNDYTGATEICTLFLKSSHRQGFAGRFLSRSRFSFISNHQKRFSDTIIAEMRGVSDEQGHSPFWQWLEEHFFSIEFPKADHLVGLGDKVFICELMPKYPIYANLLSKAAQEVIGKVHDKTAPALRLLEKEGFEYRGYVDLFDAGPTVEARIENIKTVQETVTGKVKISEVSESPFTHAISNGRLTEYKATFCNKIWWDESEQTLTISPQIADALELVEGDIAHAFCL